MHERNSSGFSDKFITSQERVEKVKSWKAKASPHI
jgi:hypothetical protein